MSESENNPEAREEPVQMHVSRGMRFQSKGEETRSFAPGDVIVTERKNVRWLEASRKAFRDKKKAAQVAMDVAAEYVGKIQHPEPDDAA